MRHYYIPTLLLQFKYKKVIKALFTSIAQKFHRYLIILKY